MGAFSNALIVAVSLGNPAAAQSSAAAAGAAAAAAASASSRSSGGDWGDSTVTDCYLPQMGAQLDIKEKCGKDVICAYYGRGSCDDPCSFSTACGYVVDNPFVHYHGDYHCSGWGPDFEMTCDPSYTPLFVVCVLAAAVLLLASCVLCLWCCVRRGK